MTQVATQSLVVTAGVLALPVMTFTYLVFVAARLLFPAAPLRSGGAIGFFKTNDGQGRDSDVNWNLVRPVSIVPSFSI